MLSLSLTTVPTAHTALFVGITAQPVNLSFVAAKTPECSQSVTFTLTPQSAFVVALSGLAASSGSVSISGATEANYSATPYGFTLGASVDSTSTSASFDVTVSDPCSTGSFVIDPIPTINAQFAGTTVLQQSYVVTNSF